LPFLSRVSSSGRPKPSCGTAMLGSGSRPNGAITCGSRSNSRACSASKRAGRIDRGRHRGDPRPWLASPRAISGRARAGLRRALAGGMSMAEKLRGQAHRKASRRGPSHSASQVRAAKVALPDVPREESMASTTRPKGWRLLKWALPPQVGDDARLRLLLGPALRAADRHLNAWLGEAKINLATIGVLSWIGLCYAFKFLWSPMVDRVKLPLLERLGRRKSWIVLCQAVLVAGFAGLAATDPNSASAPSPCSRCSRRSPRRPRTSPSTRGGSTSPTSGRRSNCSRRSTSSATASRASSAARWRWCWRRGCRGRWSIC
jgi:hypothetical protein